MLQLKGSSMFRRTKKVWMVSTEHEGVEGLWVRGGGGGQGESRSEAKRPKEGVGLAVVPRGLGVSPT